MKETKVAVGVVGATGYSGMELVRLLSSHPRVNLTYVAGHGESVVSLAEKLPQFVSLPSLNLEPFDVEVAAKRCEVVFVALPSGTAGAVAVALWNKGCVVIDLSGDLRLPQDQYVQWYHLPAVAAEAQKQAVYGLTEWHRREVSSANLIANPGCYATAAILALRPLLDLDLPLRRGAVVVDAKSGVSGAGRKPVQAFQLAELSDNFYAYKVGQHQHTPEIEAELSGLSPLLLNTQLLPIARGIFVCAYVPFEQGVDEAVFHSLYARAYEGEKFITVLPPGQVPQLKHVLGSNACHVGLNFDSRSRVLQVFSVLDNLQKGAAGQAVQNMNVRMGWLEDTGLSVLSMFP
ncbi:N-acetyl-gamma-glutamyl-phosphate reductase [Alicyclobacillaceae bacterium I2511]|nr:N-acetyl-gamma-glutamyl-phosphate reductase [Alicyclobacillaceae bacterium I2511]